MRTWGLLYKVLVRNHVEYCMVFLNRRRSCITGMVESVKMKFEWVLRQRFPGMFDL